MAGTSCRTTISTPGPGSSGRHVRRLDHRRFGWTLSRGPNLDMLNRQGMGGLGPAAGAPVAVAPLPSRGPRVGGDLPFPPTLQRQPRFNPRPRVGGDLRDKRRRSAALWLLFQSTPPRGGRLDPLATRSSMTTWYLFQSTPPRGGRPEESERILVADGDFVSIHAPAWGATLTVSDHAFARSHACFNPRPRVGGDPGIRSHRERGSDTFQSTPPRGGRPAFHRDAGRHQAVSIHAPAWGATGDVPELRGDTMTDIRFNPRPRVGGDSSLHGGISSTASLFQSTPPRGGRPDHWREPSEDLHGGFQSTPPRGGRPGDDLQITMPRKRGRFNPRPRVGGDPYPVH